MHENMKKRLPYLLSLLILFLTTACYSGDFMSSLCYSGEITSSFATESSNLSLDSKIEIHDKGDGLYEIQDEGNMYTNLEIINSCEATSGDSNQIKSVVVYGQRPPDGYDRFIEGFYLVALYRDNPLLLKIDEVTYDTADIYLNDIDGDGEVEIVLKNWFYEWKTEGLRIFKVADNKIALMFSYPEYPFNKESYNPNEKTIFAFTGTLMDNFKLVVKYPATNFTKEFDVLELHDTDFKDHYYDATGKLRQETSDIMSFWEYLFFRIEDIDNDDIYEIIAEQRATCNAISSQLGLATVTLKYSPQNEKIEVIKADFQMQNL